MIYVTSDLHGNLAGFHKLLDTINLKDTDTLFVLGDVVDRGPAPVELLMDMAFRPNVMPLLGNHDYVAFTVLSQIRDIEEGEEVEDYLDAVGLKLYEWWMDNGGQVTLDAFLAENEDSREDILDYLEEFTLYEELDAGGFSYVLVHAGLSNFSPARTLEKYSLNELLFEKPDYGKVYFEDRILVTGHTPTAWIKDCPAHKIFRKNNHLAIDLSEDNTIAAVRLDDGEEFYITTGN